MKTFKIDPSASVYGTAKVAALECPPDLLVERFGEPLEADGYKVSGEFVFSNESGDVFTIHDWKATTLYYGEESDAPTPEEFWSSDEVWLFTIGGRGEAGDFVKWLVEDLAKHTCEDVPS